jgi:hypothetical protein
MVDFWEYKQRIKKFYKFSPEEIKGLFISIIILSFIWAYNDGSETFSLVNWLINYMFVFFMMGIALFVNISMQKIFGIKYGFYVEYKIWTNGLIAGIIVTLLTKGYFPLLIPGGITLMHLSRLRIGEFRYGLNLVESSYTVIAGSYANFLIAMFVKALVWQILGIDSYLVDEFFKINLVLSVYLLLPFNPLPGIVAFIGSKFVYIFSFAILLMYILLIIIFDFYSLIWGGILGTIIYAIYYWTVEKD